MFHLLRNANTLPRRPPSCVLSLFVENLFLGIQPVHQLGSDRAAILQPNLVRPLANLFFQGESFSRLIGNFRGFGTRGNSTRSHATIIDKVFTLVKYANWLILKII